MLSATNHSTPPALLAEYHPGESLLRGLSLRLLEVLSHALPQNISNAVLGLARLGLSTTASGGSSGGGGGGGEGGSARGGEGASSSRSVPSGWLAGVLDGLAEGSVGKLEDFAPQVGPSECRWSHTYGAQCRRVGSGMKRKISAFV